VFYHQVGHPTKLAPLPTKTRQLLQHQIAPSHRVNYPQKEGRMALAIYSLNKKQFKSKRTAAIVYNVPRSTLQDRINGRRPQRGSRAKNRLLLEYEEAELIKWICSMEQRGFPPFLIDVKRMAQSILDRRRGDASRSRTIGKNWTYRFHNNYLDIQARLSRSRDSQ
jgi:hypothetical protein